MKRSLVVNVDIGYAERNLAGITALANSGVARRVLTECLQEACDSSMIGEMAGKAGGLGPMHGAAASGLNYTTMSDGVQVTAGGVEWVAGSEFGGQIKIMTYATTSRLGKRYLVTRHTTRQFNPWRGQKGYWMWPTITERLQGIREKLITALIEEAMGKAA